MLKVRDTSPGGPDDTEQPPAKKNGLGWVVDLQCSKKLSSATVASHCKGTRCDNVSERSVMVCKLEGMRLYVMMKV